MSKVLEKDIYYESPDKKFNISISQRGEKLFFCKAFGHEELESTKFVISVIRDFHQEVGEKILLYIDATNLKSMTAESRSAWFREVLGKKESIVENFCLTGVNLFVRTIANMFAKISSVPIKCFATEKQALAWLDDSYQSTY